MMHLSGKPILRNRDGAATVEFALVAPLLITMVLGVLQFGIWMNAFNSVRSAANDTGRMVTVKYQQNMLINNFDIAKCARQRAMEAPYMLTDGPVTTLVSDATTQSITGITEKSLNVRYEMPTLLSFAKVPPITVSYTRPLFVKAGVLATADQTCTTS